LCPEGGRCDGAEDCALGVCDDGACCRDGAVGGVELCDGLDDDCDGATDEAFGDLGVACNVGVGACEGAGLRVCSEDGAGTICGAVPGEAAADELCGRDPDDDCDGSIDEGFEALGQACAAGQGECRRVGALECSVDATALVCGAVPGDPVDEELDELDNDCDGEVDEGVCGNGVLDDGEACDDGNVDNGDGCEGDCTEPCQGCGCDVPACNDGAPEVIDTLNFNGMTFYPLNLDQCTPRIGPCCNPTTAQQQMDAFCRLAGRCRATDWVVQTLPSTNCYCWGGCTNCNWRSNCCGGQDQRNFVTSVTCR